MRVCTKSVLLVLALGLCVLPVRSQPVTGLDGWSIFLDPGHGGDNQNVGAFGYSEANKVLAIGLELRELLLTQTDIDTVYMSRTSDVSVSLGQRVDLANQSGASFFHSIHSNAGPPSAMYTLLLWPQLRSGAEASPRGGKRMAELMVPYLTDAMRVSTVGARGECDFYGASSCRTPGQVSSGRVNHKGSRNYVQGFTSMPSVLSEGGFHTNTTQNQRNMNAEWKRLEARALFWTILDFHGLQAPEERIAAGFITDIDTGLPINGATITIGDQSYTTDTYASLFNRYSNNPGELRNGFYYLEDLPEGPVPVAITADDYLLFEGEITPRDSFITFFDASLISTRPPQITEASPADGEEKVRLIDPIILRFDRQMDRASVEAAASIDPETGLTFVWGGDRQVTVVPDTLLPETTYTFTLAGTAEGRYGHGFDGAGTGTPGSDFVLSFTTGFPDFEAPYPLSSSPRPNARDTELRPAVSVVYNEALDPTSVEGRIHLEDALTDTRIAGDVAVYTVDEQSIITFFPAAELEPATPYVLVMESGIRDIFENTIDVTRRAPRFTTADRGVDVSLIDDFEGGLDAWWAPQQSGTTTGIVIDSTRLETETDRVLLFDDGRQALRLDYGWDVDGGPWLLREYLPPSAPQQRTFTDDVVLEAYVFGDGSGNQIRFAVDDNVPISDAGNHEVSPWITIDWIGWQRIRWDIDADGTGSWLGDGTPTGTLRFDSFQMTYAEGADAFGRIAIDDLRVVRPRTATPVEPTADLPEAYLLEPNYPNPFNPATTLRFHLPEAADATLAVYDVMGRRVATLRSGLLPAGTHEASWDGRDAAGTVVASGVYLARFETPAFRQTRRMLLVK